MRFKGILIILSIKKNNYKQKKLLTQLFNKKFIQMHWFKKKYFINI